MQSTGKSQVSPIHPHSPLPTPISLFYPDVSLQEKKFTMGLYWIAFSRYHFLKIGRHLLEEVIILC